MRHSIYHSIAAAFFLLAGIQSCSFEGPLEPDFHNSDEGISLTFTNDPMLPYKVTTKALDVAADPKDEEEKRINNLHIFFFTSGGEYLTGGYLQGYIDDNAPQTGGYYAPGRQTTILKISKTDQNGNSLFDDTEAASSAIVYAVANVDASLFAEKDEYGRPQIIADRATGGITPLKALESVIFTPAQGVSVGIPAGGMPMAGYKELDLTAEGGTDNTTAGNRTILLKALMARVDVSIDLRSETSEGRLPAFQLMDWTVRNMPMGCTIGEPATGEYTGDFGTNANGIELTEETVSFQRVIYNNNEQSIDFSFYVFENMQEAEWIKDEGEQWANSDLAPGSEGTENDLYPKNEGEEGGFEEHHKQRYKPYIADRANATSLELHGFYTTYNDYTYEVSYTLYLGANHTDDFSLRRNYQYINNITVKGIDARDDNSGEYTLDARVNVDTEANNFYISILRERNHDAHFCVTPMDVYLFADESRNPRMTVSIDDPDQEWIKMELIKAADMEKGTVSESGFTAYAGAGTGDHLATGTPWTAGNGKRAFFTTSLFKAETPLKDEVEVTTTRDRVYFYIDENLSDSEDRTATVTLTYYEGDSDIPVEIRELDITQVHLLKVQVYDRKEMYMHNETGDLISSDAYSDLSSREQNNYTQVSVRDESKPYLDPETNPENSEYNNPGGIIYMEQYEEYLDHYDPLDEYNTSQVYTGLPWANTDFEVAVEEEDYCILDEVRDRAGMWVNESYSNYWDGHSFSGLIITFRLPSSEKNLTLNGKPETAFGYCYNKNKRKDDGTIYFGIVKKFGTGLSSWIEYDNVIDYDAKWFLPGIRQMEDALYEYYSMFPEFQDNYYWSSATAREKYYHSLDIAHINPMHREVADRARATKVDPQGFYVESNENQENFYPNGGNALRSQVLRIRAFRIDLKPYDY